MKLSTLLEFNKILNPNKARLIRGPTGIGKSSIVKYIAQSIGANLIDIRLPELEPTDLVGLPYLHDSKGTKVTKYAQPNWWPSKSKKPVVLFLDELDRASEDMQPIAMQLCLDRRAGGRNLSDNVVVWAACNGEKYITKPIDQALMDRFVVIDLMPSVEEWIDWAEKNNVNHYVLDFIRTEKARLDTPQKLIGKANIVCPSRRSWAELGFALNNLQGDIAKNENLIHYAQAFVGHVDAQAFVKWVKESYYPINVDHIMTGTLLPINCNILQITSVVDQAVAAFMKKTTSKSHRKNCLKFFINAGDEVFAAFFAALPSKAGPIIEGFPEIDEFIQNKKKSLI